MIYDEYSYGRNAKVKRIENGFNEGITELVLREYRNISPFPKSKEIIIQCSSFHNRALFYTILSYMVDQI